MSWEKHQIHVTESLKLLEGQNQIILEKVTSLEKDMAAQKVKSGFWGALVQAEEEEEE